MTGLTIFLFAVLCTFTYYLFARAEVTRPIWSRYPKWLDRMALCPACSGFWLGLGLAAAFLPWGWTGLGLVRVPTLALGGVLGLVLTPVGMALLKLSLTAAAVAAEAEEAPAVPEEPTPPPPVVEPPPPPVVEPPPPPVVEPPPPQPQLPTEPPPKAPVINRKAKAHSQRVLDNRTKPK